MREKWCDYRKSFVIADNIVLFAPTKFCLKNFLNKSYD